MRELILESSLLQKGFDTLIDYRNIEEILNVRPCLRVLLETHLYNVF